MRNKHTTPTKAGIGREGKKQSTLVLGNQNCLHEHAQSQKSNILFEFGIFLCKEFLFLLTESYKNMQQFTSFQLQRQKFDKKLLKTCYMNSEILTENSNYYTKIERET